MNKLVVALSSRALFDLDESHQVFMQHGLDQYADHQIKNELVPLLPGVAFNLAKKLLALRHPDTDEVLVEVILVSRNSSDTGLRIFNSIQYHNLAITRAAFTNGQTPYAYLKAFTADLFLSANLEDVKNALLAQCPAATILSTNPATSTNPILKIAFDGDSVLFSDEAERIYQADGLSAFNSNETESANTPLAGGPFKSFLQKLHDIQTLYRNDNCPIRTALITARSAPAHERVIKTLRDWQIRIDESLFLGGMDKANFIQAFAADFYFDDQLRHCQPASQHVATAHVPHGIVNEKQVELSEK